MAIVLSGINYSMSPDIHTRKTFQFKSGLFLCGWKICIEPRYLPIRYYSISVQPYYGYSDIVIVTYGFNIYLLIFPFHTRVGSRLQPCSALGYEPVIFKLSYYILSFWCTYVKVLEWKWKRENYPHPHCKIWWDCTRNTNLLIKGI